MKSTDLRFADKSNGDGEDAPPRSALMFTVGVCVCASLMFASGIIAARASDAIGALQVRECVLC